MLPEPVKWHFDQARETAMEHRLKFPRLRSDLTKLSQHGCDLIAQSLVLIDRADSIIAKDKTFLRGGHANPAMLPMQEDVCEWIEEVCKWTKASNAQAIECTREANASRTGLTRSG